jgi:hypothetical protein
VNTFEDPVTVEVPADMLQKALDGASIYQKEIPLAPGMYRLNIVCKDVTGGNLTTYPMALNVPHFDDEKLSSSSLILADLIEKVPSHNIGTGQFVIGDTKVRPRLTDTFDRGEKLGIYTQFYNFSPDEKTKKPNASIEYDITKTGAASARAALHRGSDRHPGGVLAAGDGREAPAAPIAGAWPIHVEYEGRGQEQQSDPHPDRQFYGKVGLRLAGA